MYQPRPSRWKQEEGINLTPLLDMIFNLIFFFILATTIGRSQQIAVELPEAQTGEPRPSEQVVSVIAITGDNRYFLDGVEMDLEDVVRQVAQGVESGGVAGVRIDGDAASDWQAVVRVFDSLRKNQITNFNINISPQLLSGAGQ